MKSMKRSSSAPKKLLVYLLVCEGQRVLQSLCPGLASSPSRRSDAR